MMFSLSLTCGTVAHDKPVVFQRTLGVLRCEFCGLGLHGHFKVDVGTVLHEGVNDVCESTLSCNVERGCVAQQRVRACIGLAGLDEGTHNAGLVGFSGGVQWSCVLFVCMSDKNKTSKQTSTQTSK